MGPPPPSFLIKSIGQGYCHKTLPRMRPGPSKRTQKGGGVLCGLAPGKPEMPVRVLDTVLGGGFLGNGAQN